MTEDKGYNNGDRDDNDDGISCFIQTEIHIAAMQTHRKLKNKTK